MGTFRFSDGKDVDFVAFDVVQPCAADRDARTQAVVIPDGAVGERLEFFLQRQAGGQVAGGFGRAQQVDGFDQGQQQGFDHAPRADDPGGDAVDAGVEEVQADVDSLQVIAAHQFLGDRLQFVRQRDHVVAVPPHAAADVQQQFVQVQHHGRDLVRDDLGGMEMPGVQAQQLFRVTA
jgi:hypothetical protein